MKKIYVALVVCMMLPLSMFASNNDIAVSNGMKYISAASPCGLGG